MTLQERLTYLDKQFDFINHPEDFDFNLSPERVAYRNEALRTKNRDLYTGYLADHFPDEMAAELDRFDKTAAKLRQVSPEEAEDIFRSKGINLLQSDLSYHEADAIYKLLKVADEDLPWHLEGSTTDLLNSKVRPSTVLQQKRNIWLITE